MTLPLSFRRAFAGLLLLAAAAPASAQLLPLDGQWFKLKVHAVGRSVDAGNLLLHKDSLKSTVFLHLALAETDGGTGVTYDWQLWTKQDGNVWAQSDAGTQAFLGSGSGDQLAVDLPLDLQLTDGRFLQGRATLLFNLKLKKKNGKLKKAVVRTLGGETVDGSANGTDTFVGGFSLKGHDVKVGKLPFTPP